MLSLAALSDALFQAMLCHGEIVTIRFAVALAQATLANERTIAPRHRRGACLAFTLHGVEYAASSSGSIELMSAAGAAFSAGPATAYRVAA